LVSCLKVLLSARLAVATDEIFDIGFSVGRLRRGSDGLGKSIIKRLDVTMGNASKSTKPTGIHRE
jgi:hypothetical protein